jgi:DNA primase
VTPQTGQYFWNSRTEYGDVFDFVGRHVPGYDNRWNNRDATQFMEAVNHLAQRAGISLDNQTDFHKSYAWAERQLVMRLHEMLLKTPPALTYVTQTRGWQPATIKAARLGFMPQDKRLLLADLNLPDKWKTVISKFPSGMLVYIHLEKGRLSYLSGRSIEGKQHYNPPRELLGERRSYYNHVYTPDVDCLVLVEGQADAITFAEWGVPALAIAGMHLSDELMASIKKSHKRVFVALDNTPEAMEKNREIARTLGATALIPRLPSEVKDANDWLAKHGTTGEDVQTVLNKAKTWLQAETERIAYLEGLERKDGLRALFQYALDLDEMELSEFRAALATQVIYGGCDADTAEFYSKASGTATTDANTDDPNSHLRQRPLLTVDEVITPQIGNCTIFARYVEAGFATQVILNARLTRFYERDDWKQRMAAAQSEESLLLERGIDLSETNEDSMATETDAQTLSDGASSIEIAARAKLAAMKDQTEKITGSKVKLSNLDNLRARYKAAAKQEIDP